MDSRIEIDSLAGAPDQFIYELTVEDQGQRRTVCCQERAVSSELRHCLEWITTKAARIA
ncbi:MAG: hypothetical protein HY401_06005 [Elusimicrobia bacterium]|nr:hypothetical protein [Elusimicrobiota bacterium]